MVRFSAGRGLVLAAALIGSTFATRADQPAAPETIAIAAKGLGVSEDVVKLGVPYFDPQSRVSIPDVQGALDWYYAQGMITTHIDARKIADFRYAIEAPATMGGRSSAAAK
jgi:hypothetical protein